MKILITGGAGYKGLKLAQALLERGHAVTVFDVFMYGYDPALFLFRYPRVSFVRKDIRNIEEKDVSSYDVIFHLAAISGYPACESNPHSAQMINVGGTERLLSHLSENQLLVYASTTSIYGKNDVVCTEETVVKPASLYAATKYEAEKMCLARGQSVALRFATIFGVAPRMRWDLLPNDFVMKAVHERSLVLFDSKSVRTFLHIDDAITAYLMILDHSDTMAGRVFNVGCESMNLSKLQLAELIKEHIDFAIIDSSIPDLDVRHFIVNFDEIARSGFRPQKTIHEGIDELITLFRFYKPVQAYKVVV